MAQRFSLAGTKRKDSLGALRQQGLLPGVLYGHGLKSISVAVEQREFAKVYKAAGSTSLVGLKLDDGQEHTVLIRETQYHPVQSHLLHVDFYQVRLDEEIRAKVPVRFVGESAAIKDLGGVLVRSLDAIDLSALPAALPHDIEVDISVLNQFDKVIRISDLNLPKEITLFHEPDDVLALVQAPRTQEEIDQELSEGVEEDVASVEGVEDKEAPAEEGAESAKEDGAAPEKTDQSDKKAE